MKMDVEIGSVRGGTMKTRSIFIFYGVFALGLFGVYQYKGAERQESAREAKIQSQALNESIDRIIEKSDTVLRILESTQADLEETSKDLNEVKGILKLRNKNEK